MWEHYESAAPGQVQMLGPDFFNGLPANLAQFKASTGATFPLLLNGGVGSGNENLYVPYGDRDSYAVINKQGIVRYQAYDLWPYGNRYHLSEIRGAVDSLITIPSGVEDGVTPRGYALRIQPNPFRGRTTLDLVNAAITPLDATVAAYDLSGRRVARLWGSPAPRGVTRIDWDGCATNGSMLAPGVYVIRAQLGHVRLSRRVIRIQ